MSFHDDFTSEDDRGWSVDARGRLDLSRRSNLQGLVSREVHQEGRSDIDATTTGERPDVTTDQAQLAFNHRFNRLSIQLRGSLADVDYSATRSGIIVTTNADRDTRTTDGAIRASWEFKPTLSLFSEVGLNTRRYDVAADSDGLFRDSDGERYRAGINFGSTGQTLRGEVSVGYGRQNPDAPELSDISAFLIDANLAWRATELTSLLLTARTELSDTTTAGSAGVAVHQAGVEVRHAFRRYLIATAGLSYTNYDYDSAPIEERELITTVGADYYANRDVILFARYQHIAYESNQSQSDYHADDVRLGVRVRQ
jgi:hypothetical protein